METILEKIKTTQRAFRSGVLVEAREPKFKAIHFDGSEESIQQIKKQFPKAYLNDSHLIVIPTERELLKIYESEVIVITSTDITVLTVNQLSKLFYVTDEPETINS